MYGADRSFEIEPQCARTATLPSQLIRRHCLTAVEPAEHLEPLVDAIGSEHFFFGTDFPHPEFRRYYNTAAAILDRPALSQEAKDNILGSNIARCLRLGRASHFPLERVREFLRRDDPAWPRISSGGAPKVRGRSR